jgi:hypothetical protein
MTMQRFFRAVVAPMVLITAATLAEGCLGPPFVEGAVGVDVGIGPPAFRSEVRIIAPGEGYYWVPGYWDWNERDWFWVSGAWQRPPRVGARWVAPQYRHRHGRWQYYRGYWR